MTRTEIGLVAVLLVAFFGAMWFVLGICRAAAERERAEAGPLPVRDRFVELPGFPGPSAPSQPGPEPEVRFAEYPPGCLGAHPESAPYPGPLSAAADDVTDLLTGVLRLRHGARH